MIAQAALRQMQIPGGKTMSVAMTNCGDYGWVSDRSGYRYSATDPQTGSSWPAIPESLFDLAVSAAKAAGFDSFLPDACLINCYLTGCKMSLHQDKDEQDMTAPIVSVSLGIDAVFQLGGFNRNDAKQRVPLSHGDVLVWGGEDRLRYHGVLTVKAAKHLLMGGQRINLTFRKSM